MSKANGFDAVVIRHVFSWHHEISSADLAISPCKKLQDRAAQSETTGFEYCPKAEDSELTSFQCRRATDEKSADLPRA